MLDRLRSKSARGAAAHSAPPSDLGRTVVKTAAVMLTIAVVAVPGIWGTAKVLRSQVESVGAGLAGSLNARTLAARIEADLNKLANHPLAPEREAQIRNNLRLVVKRLQPFAGELQPLFACPDASGRTDAPRP